MESGMRQVRPQPRPARSRRWPLLVLALTGLTACSSADANDGGPDTDGAAGTDGEWAPLFDGTSFAGWRGIESEAIPEGHWTIEQGEIRKLASKDVPTAPDGQPLVGGDIMTIETYSSFELTFEWKVAPGANSGIKYNVSQEMSVSNVPSSAALGFEYQVLDDELHPDAANGETRQAGALYDLIPPIADKPLRPVGEFNEGRIVFVDGHGEHWLNGVKVLEYDVGSQPFDEHIAASKYAPIDGFADPRSGHIVLQDHGDDVWYRNLRIRVIEP
jgi:hypothetical protein